MFAVLWGLYVNYSRSVVIDIHILVQCERHICSGDYASNEYCMYTSALGHIIDCIVFK